MRERITRRRVLLALGIGLVLLLLAPALIVRVQAGGMRSGDPKAFEHHQVALVLGAGLIGSGRPSPFLADRLNGAIELYKLGKVDGLLMSGDNHTAGYDEPSGMRAYAIARGVPAAAITLDYAGFDTYDSCMRARKVFGVSSAIVVTQSYHTARAVFLCNEAGIDTAGLGMPDWGRYPTTMVARYQVRELLASGKAVWDADISHRSPRFLGKTETLHLDPVNG